MISPPSEGCPKGRVGIVRQAHSPLIIVPVLIILNDIYPMKQMIIQLLKRAAWAPLGVVILHAICGDIFGHEPYVDPIMHFLGGAAIAYFLRAAAELFSRLTGPLTDWGFDLMSFGLASVAAVVWEFGEWLSDVWLGTNIQHSGSAPLRDLALGLFGAAAYLLFRRLRA